MNCHKPRRASIVPQNLNDSSTPSAPSAAPKAKKFKTQWCPDFAKRLPKICQRYPVESWEDFRGIWHHLALHEFAESSCNAQWHPIALGHMAVLHLLQAMAWTAWNWRDGVTCQEVASGYAAKPSESAQPDGGGKLLRSKAAVTSWTNVIGINWIYWMWFVIRIVWTCLMIHDRWRMVSWCRESWYCHDAESHDAGVELQQWPGKKWSSQRLFSGNVMKCLQELRLATLHASQVKA